MNKWLKLICVLLTVLTAAAFAVAEEAAEEDVIIYFQDGSRVSIPAEIANDEQSLADYCNKYFPGRAYTKDADAAVFNYDTTIAADWVASQYGEGSRAMSARLVKLGLHTSVVASTDGAELAVPTRYLTMYGNDDMEHHVAIVSAPRTGKASMREKAASSSEVLASCLAGRIVAVVEYSNASFTKILYEEEEGYIRTDCLIFNDGSKAPMGEGTVHIKDAVDGKSTVTIRATASKSSAKVAAIPTGTVVTVHDTEGDWYAIEWDGWFGYIQDQYLKLNEE